MRPGSDVHRSGGKIRLSREPRRGCLIPKATLLSRRTVAAVAARFAILVMSHTHPYLPLGPNIFTVGMIRNHRVEQAMPNKEILFAMAYGVIRRTAAYAPTHVLCEKIFAL